MSMGSSQSKVVADLGFSALLIDAAVLVQILVVMRGNLTLASSQKMSCVITLVEWKKLYSVTISYNILPQCRNPKAQT